ELLDLYPNLNIALRLLLTVPLTVTSGERGFLRLKLLKNYLHSTASQDRLNRLAEISMECKIRHKLDFSKIIEDFASSNLGRSPSK
ncbi:hypothetical protein G0U57_007553, partial [Chelydra serpentina]